MSCHSVHEYDEVRMFNKLGYDVFSPSAYYNPQCSDYLRPGINGLFYDDEDIKTFDNLVDRSNPNNLNVDNKDCLTKDFLKSFDVVFVMSLADRWIVDQWDVLKDKVVVWRTNGQSNPMQEHRIKNIRDKYPNLKIIRYSPTENTVDNYAGEDRIIRFGKRPDEYVGWNGHTNKLLTVCQAMKKRSTACSWDVFNTLSKMIPTTLAGISNEECEQWIGRKLKESELLDLYKNYRVYFYTGTHPANYTLNFIEAWMTGIPIVALGPNRGNDPNYNTYEVHKLIDHGVNGFVSDDIDKLKKYIMELMTNENLRNDISKNGRESAIKYFNEYDKEGEWASFFKTL
tara:strand:+ start:2495 stop:3520 length:1026 start_codon:yes stop_codon:yes gene_type:complete